MIVTAAVADICGSTSKQIALKKRERIPNDTFNDTFNSSENEGSSLGDEDTSREYESDVTVMRNCNACAFKRF